MLTPESCCLLSMVTGTLQVRLLARGARTLKDKRQVVRSILDRMRNDFNVSAAEVDGFDDYRTITLGFAMVGRDSAQVRDSLQRITDALRRHPIAEFVGSDLEI